MKLTPLLLFLLTGCASLSQVEMSIKCDELRGRVKNSCTITAPSNADVSIDGETITIDYYGAVK